MSENKYLRRWISIVLIPFFLSGCLFSDTSGNEAVQDDASDTSSFVVSIEDEPDTVDFQCTTIHYTIATNVFDRLVETVVEDGEAMIVPSLAESWRVSDEGMTYTFHLRDDVTFSDGSLLTADDVYYTFRRLLTHPDSCNRDIVEMIRGAVKLEKGESSELEGFKVLGDYDFSITLEYPFEAFLACLSMPGASILDKELTEKAGERFGIDPEWTIGTGPYILKKWEEGKGMILIRNDSCWQGPARNAGLDLRFISESEDVRRMFEEGELDVLDLDEVAHSAEYFYRGDIYQDYIYKVQRIGTTYIALNESIEPLNDVRVRKALQLSLNRQLLLDAVYSGRGTLENGIYPHGLYGFNPDLPEIPYDVEEAKRLLKEAGYPDGFKLVYSFKPSSNEWEILLARLVVSMWEKIGVKAVIEVIDENEFMKLRKSGKLACYSASWMADYDDPDNFIYTFFGDKENTAFRSLCYPNEEIMARVSAARAISDKDARIEEYQELEKIIIQDDAAWIPLFSRQYIYVTSPRVKGVCSAWNGSVKNRYREIEIVEE